MKNKITVQNLNKVSENTGKHIFGRFINLKRRVRAWLCFRKHRGDHIPFIEMIGSPKCIRGKFEIWEEKTAKHF